MFILMAILWEWSSHKFCISAYQYSIFCNYSKKNTFIEKRWKIRAIAGNIKQPFSVSRIISSEEIMINNTQIPPLNPKSVWLKGQSESDYYKKEGKRTSFKQQKLYSNVK